MEIHMGINVGGMFTDLAVNIPGEGFRDLPEIGRQVRPKVSGIHLGRRNRDRPLNRLKQFFVQRQRSKPIDECKFRKLPFVLQR